jgi:putative FmdB family regulatory protein
MTFLEYLCSLCGAKFVIVWITTDRELYRCPSCGYELLKKVAETQAVALAKEPRT